MARFKLTVEYDGTGLAGWQSQPDQPSVQGFLKQAAHALCEEPIDMIAAGRTDAGVHAIAQIVHFDTTKNLLPFNVMQGINFHLIDLSPRIIVTKAEAVDENFHARFSAKNRSYLYRIVNRRVRLALDRERAWHILEPLNSDAMHEAAQLLLGDHDFTTFRSTMCQAASPLKTLDRLDVIRHGEEIHIHAKARSFLHHQVRNMVGSLRMIGNGKWDNNALLAALAARDRSAGGATAPPHGLYFVHVEY